jgi:hypothetical protein
MAKKRGAGAPRKTTPGWKRNVVPDKVDLRDRPYMPSVMVIPAQVLAPKVEIPVLNQHETNACTGFALASVIYHLQYAAKRKPADCAVSPFMLYSMARRYDEFPGDPNADTGSSLRGAMKGWYKHGVCSYKLWTTEEMPRPANKAADDWWLDAVRRPLGAYYRVDARSVTDMQIALNEIGVLYASAACHSGWSEGLGVHTGDGFWTIPQQKAAPEDGAHAFAVVGYNREGFVIQNSWDTNWGSGGRALLTYEDWLENAMDCWVAQLGVTTDLHLEIAASKTLRVKAGKVRLASDNTLRNREIGPFVIGMEKNGRLSNTGDFRTQEMDVETLVNQQLAEARAAWGLRVRDPVDIAIYAHNGLTSEDQTAKTAAKWITALYNQRIFPIFFMWGTDFWSTLKHRAADLLRSQAGPTGGMPEEIKGWWNTRLERLLAIPGTAVWNEVKKNADTLTSSADSGGMRLFEACMKPCYFAGISKVRLHLIGHSAGSIVHSHIVDRFGANGWKFESVNFLAPAVRVDFFEARVLPAIRTGQVKRFNEFHLSDDVEQKDPTCDSVLGYGRSLLYLVSQSFEKGQITPILGMEKYFNDRVRRYRLPNVKIVTAPSDDSKAITHDEFDDDATTMHKVISLIKS